MLVLTRRRGDVTFFDFSSMTDAELLELRSNPISVSVTSVHGDRVKLGFGAPVPVQIQRKEAMLKNAQLISAGGSVTRQN